jgi:iron complex outermembrane receptor protein
MTRHVFLAAGALAAALPSSPRAQEAPTAAPVEVEEIVVRDTIVETTAGPVQGLRALTADTATGARTPLREVPQSVAVVPRSVIDSQQSRTVGDALRNVASVQVNDPRSTPAFDSTLLRGFSAEQFLDGLTLYQYAPGDRESLINVERIEVVKGPTAILFGGGSGAAAGGVINIVSKMPEAAPFGRAGITIGTTPLAQPFFDVNRPITDTVLFRMTGEYSFSEGDVDVVETERYNINPTLRVTDNDVTTLTLQGRFSRWEQPEYQGLPATGTVAGDFRIGRDLFIGPEDIEDSFAETASATATLTHRFDETWSARAIARYSASEFEENVQTIFGADGFVADAPFTAPSTWAFANAELFQEQEELSFAASALAEFGYGPTRNKLLVGADYSALDDEGFLQFTDFLGFVDLANPVFDTPYADPGNGVNDLFVENRTMGVYAQIQSSVHDRLHVVGSLRLGSVEVDYRNDGTGGSASTEETRLLPRIGAVFDVTDALSVFASYGEGLRGQPFLEFVGEPEPEESRQVEAGVKLDFGFGLSGQVALFQIDRTNVPVTDTATFLSVAEGEERSRGVDADLVWKLTDDLSLIASYAYVDAEFTEDAPTFSGVIPAGNKLPGVPEHAGRIWAEYAFPQPGLAGLSIGAGVYAQTGEKIGDNNRFESDGFYTVDAALRYQAERFDAALSVRNLTDQEYFDRYNYFGGRVAPSEGIAAFATVAVTF